MTKTNSSEEAEASWLLISEGKEEEKKKKSGCWAAVKHKGEEKSSKQDKTELMRNSAPAALWDGR